MRKDKKNEKFVPDEYKIPYNKIEYLLGAIECMELREAQLVVDMLDSARYTVFGLSSVMELENPLVRRIDGVSKEIKKIGRTVKELNKNEGNYRDDEHKHILDTAKEDFLFLKISIVSDIRRVLEEIDFTPEEDLSDIEVFS